MRKKLYIKQDILENLIYLIFWIIVFSAPIFIFYNNGVRNWELIFLNWKITFPFFIFFLINNYILLPFLFLRKKKIIYLGIISIIVLFLAVFNPLDNKQNRDRKYRMPPRPPRTEMYDRDIHPKKRPVQPLFPGKNGWLVILIIAGINIAIRLLLKSIQDEKHLKELEKHSLETELNYLKAQINPHFFMNTLNNIHALIDIDQEKAKGTVIDLSKMMRYVLYDAEQKNVPLSKEIDLISNYVDLMKIRYTDKLAVSLELPPVIPDVNLPPLLFISFIENAFKHGVSYRFDSYIYIRMEIVDNQLHFSIRNSNFNNEKTSEGVGLDNVSKRLKLLYNDNYLLNLNSDEHEYSVDLTIPLYL